MKIHEVSKRYDISSDTLRYYERIGLLPHITRNKSGIRDYSEEDLKTVEFVKCMRSAGISVESLIEYMELLNEGSKTQAARKVLLNEEREKLVARIEQMNETLARLNFKIDHYDEIMAKACKVDKK